MIDSEPTTLADPPKKANNAPRTAIRAVEFKDLMAADSSGMTRDKGDLGRQAPPRAFKSPIRFEDEVTITVQLDRLGEKSATYAFQFTHQQREVAVGSLTAVCCRIPPGGVPFSIAIPDAIGKKLQSLLQT